LKWVTRRKTGFARTDSIVISLVAYTVNSCLLVCLLSFAMIISFVVAPNTMIWPAIYWTISKCYVNSLLAMLNSREYVRDRSTINNPENEINLSSIRIEPSTDAYGSSKSAVSVTVHRSTTMNFGLNKSNPDEEPTFDVTKPGATITPFRNQDQKDQTLESNV